MAYSAPNVHRSQYGTYPKEHRRPAFASTTSKPRATNETRESYETEHDTEFEEDLSDFEEYSGRRSEDSGKQSDTTLSSYDELSTPHNATDDFDGFDFRLDNRQHPKKPVEGPVGPHLFRLSQESSSQDVNFYLSMSPPVSPDEPRAGPLIQPRQSLQAGSNGALRTSVPLFTWTPRQVTGWMQVVGFEKSVIEQFYINDISGSTLIDLKYEDLKELGITSFGHRHRLWNEIRSLKEKHLVNTPLTPPEEHCYTPSPTLEQTRLEGTAKNCSSPDTPEEDQYIRLPISGIRHGRRRRHSNDIISPAESASIVAIEQLLPKPHKCSKGENCSKWQKQQRKLARIATEFPMEIQQINAAAQASPVESGLGAQSTIVPSIVASSDLLGPGQVLPLRLEENALRVVQSRDPQENVRQFLSFQHMNGPAHSPQTPPYEMFPPLSPPTSQAPHQNLRSLPKLTIPTDPLDGAFSPDRTAVPSKRATPLTAVDMRDRKSYHNIYRLDSPASDMDVPVTAIPMGPIERDVSSSVPPDMRFGGNDPLQHSISHAEYRRPRPVFLTSHHPNKTFSPIQRSTSTTGHRRQPSFAMAPLTEYQPVTEANYLNPTDDSTRTPTVDEVKHAGWMKKRKTKMLRHEWHDNHFRLNGTLLAMHKDEKAGNALECIDVDEYAVACSSIHSGKLNSAFKRLQLNGKKKDGDAAAYAFQLVPAAEKKGILNAATGKTHHFAVKTGNERIDWMRELMLAKALKKQKGVEVGHSSFD